MQYEGFEKVCKDCKEGAFASRFIEKTPTDSRGTTSGVDAGEDDARAAAAHANAAAAHANVLSWQRRTR